MFSRGVIDLERALMPGGYHLDRTLRGRGLGLGVCRTRSHSHA